MPDQAPIARPRFSAGKAVESSVSVSGVTIAAPAPCSARAAISAPVVGASAAPAEASVKRPRPIDEHPAAAEAIAERGAGQQQHREGQRVGVDGPFERLQPAAEIGADRRQGGGDHEVVEDDHEERDRDDRERPQRTCARGGGHGSKCSLTSMIRQPFRERLSAKLVSTHNRQTGRSAQGTSTESSVGESRATMYSAGSVSETFWTVWVSRGGT